MQADLYGNHLRRTICVSKEAMERLPLSNPEGSLMAFPQPYRSLMMPAQHFESGGFYLLQPIWPSRLIRAALQESEYNDSLNCNLIISTKAQFNHLHDNSQIKTQLHITLPQTNLNIFFFRIVTMNQCKGWSYKSLDIELSVVVICTSHRKLRLYTKMQYINQQYFSYLYLYSSSLTQKQINIFTQISKQQILKPHFFSINFQYQFRSWLKHYYVNIVYKKDYYACPKIHTSHPKDCYKDNFRDQQCQFKCRTNLGCLRRLFRVTILEV
ncbi:Hypothetical_protein [Hexamita inflata]|uniref:Hypothetical_protein n=1 Tax=Hexamita inflata TaxID=28002 RepID=A0AA86PLK0_9EUKA|nr:Hypothetical protein HINF_LOCUS29960 [Hexamita inflata]